MHLPATLALLYHKSRPLSRPDLSRPSLYQYELRSLQNQPHQKPDILNPDILNHCSQRMQSALAVSACNNINAVNVTVVKVTAS